MLKLSNIIKNYKVADTEVHALKGINLCFRKSEFVSILGPSGCGKTTMLNIIGGLDQYTSGDLTISGRSTKEFKDRDWDVYRNHRVGFIFQAYNLIPHQTILGNVELALTIAGISKAERQERARKALDRVGLKGMYNKRPNQMSGGQCQRVAIARALVNEPEILLADEPTGALDTETSIQIMDLIQEIAKERLVIMVTHNPDLAYKYSTRIIKLLDGNVLEDSNPFSEEEEQKEMDEVNQKIESSEGSKNIEKAKMSFWTAFKLSAKNLQTKFKRTFMVALAGCIGIVGVSTVLAVSNGVQNYISDMENDMLSGYPVYITTSSLDYSSILGGGLSNTTSDINPENDKTKLYINSLVQTLVNMNGVTSTNNISDDYMDFLSKMPKGACELIQYNYGDKIAPNIYTDFKTCDGKSHKMSVAAIQATYASTLEGVEEFSSYASMISSVTVMTEMPSKASYIENQYDIVYIENGLTLEDVLNDKSSLVAVASKNRNTLNDLELAEYGYFDQELFLNYCYKMGGSDLYNPASALQIPETMDYKDLAAKKFTWYPNDTVYTKGDTDEDLGDKYYASAYSDGTLSTETDSKYDNYKRDAFGSVDGSLDLNVKCVLKLKNELSYGCLTAGGLYYTNELSKHMRSYNLDSDICESAKSTGTLYNVELGYNFKFDGNTAKTLEKHYLAAGSSAIMDYISQFLGSSGSTSKQVSSYSLAALGGAKSPATVYFYCNDFEQKDLLTNYLDKWNDSTQTNLYKVDSNGFYVGHQTDENGKDVLTYYHYDERSKKYYKINLSSDGYATDYNGNKYKLIRDDETETSGFYLKKSDTYGEEFTLEGSIKLTDGISINAYTLAQYVILGDKFEDSNIYYDLIEAVPDKGGNLYRYKDSEGNYKYVMKVANQSYYKIELDSDGNIVAVNNGFKKYRYEFDEETGTDKFYALDYEIDEYNYKEVVAPLEYEKGKYYYKDNDNYINITDEYKFNNEIANGLYVIGECEYVAAGADSEYESGKYFYLKNGKYTVIEEQYVFDTEKANGIYTRNITKYDAANQAFDYQIGTYYYKNNDGEYVLSTSRDQIAKGLYERDGVKSYKLVSTDPIEEDDIKNLYASEDKYNYANGVKNPKFTINDTEYTLDTKGLYIDTTSFSNLNSGSTVLTYFTIDTTNHIITINDYSKFTFYYRDLNDTASAYFYVDYREETKDNTTISYIYGTNLSSYLDMTSLAGTEAEQYISDRYILNSDGTLQSVIENFSDTALTVAQMLDVKIIGDEALTDLSILEIDDSLKVSYTDTIGLVISMVNILIQVITYSLIAFTALSLVVSTVMIGIITYVSVVERTKEIGVIRSLGGRKKDVSHLFNAETFIIGLAAGTLGIAITYLLSLVINLILGSIVGIYTIAALPWWQAIIMILISIFLTCVSGLIPARSAARQDPVNALRSE